MIRRHISQTHGCLEVTGSNAEAVGIFTSGEIDASKYEVAYLVKLDGEILILTEDEYLNSYTLED